MKIEVEKFNKNNPIKRVIGEQISILKENSISLDKMVIGREYRIISVDEYYYIISDEQGILKSTSKSKNGRIIFKDINGTYGYPRFCFEQNFSFAYIV